MNRIIREIILIIILPSTPIQIYSQYNGRSHMFGPRVPNFDSRDFKYLDTVIYDYEITIDSIVELSMLQIDTFSHRENFRELVFKYSSDSIYRYREHISSGQLINSKRNGFWQISSYDFFGNPKSSFCDKWSRIDLYFNDHRLFDASYPISSGKLELNHDLNQVLLRFTYEVHDSLIMININCIQDTLNDYYACTLGTDSIEITKVKSDYLDMELQFLFRGEYDRKIKCEPGQLGY